MSYFDVPSGISYDDWIQSLDDGRPHGFCHACKKNIYASDTIIFESHLDYAYCSEDCFFKHNGSPDDDTIESLGGEETTLIEIGISEWQDQEGY